MKPAIQRLTAASFVLFVSVSFAAPPAMNVVEHPITSTSAWETTPRLGNDGVSDLVVYASSVLQPDGSMGKGDIWYRRLEPTGAPILEPIRVTDDALDNLLDDVSGDYIVYTAYDSTQTLSGRIMVWQISTAQLYEIARADVIQEPRICGNKVVWRQGGANAASVMLYDLAWLSTGRTDADYIGGPVPPTYTVDIGDRYVVWAERWDSQQNIVAYDLAEAIRFAVTDTPTVVESEPSSSGGWIVWQAQDKGTAASRIVAKNLDTAEERVIADGGVFNFRPSIDGDLIAWESMADGNLDVFVYRLSTGESFQVTEDPFDQYLNDVFGNKVAYVDQRTGTEDIYVASFNAFPLANAGADQTVHLGSTVTLDGAASSDPDRHYPLAFAWTLVQVPAGSAAALADANTATPRFTPDVRGEYVVELVVTDALGAPSVPDEVRISTRNTAPVAAAGPDQSVTRLGTTVRLDGSTSYDPDGDAITFNWSFTSKPIGSLAELSSAVVARPSFTADLYGRYELSLTVTDPFGQSAADEVVVSFDNVRPVADAGDNLAVVAPSTVQLDGSASSDANGDPLAFQWSVVSAPMGSAALLNGATTETPSFVADVAGQFVVSLIVSDGLLTSEPSNVTITATSTSSAAIGALGDIVEAVNELPAAGFKNPNMAKTLTNKIAAVIQLIEQGNYAEARNKLTNDILAKTDGCATVGAPDKNDWITNCADQSNVYPYLVQVINMLR